MAQLGGHACLIESRTTQISHGDTGTEIGQILGRYFDGIAIRMAIGQVGNAYLNGLLSRRVRRWRNMQCDVYHPFQCWQT